MIEFDAVTRTYGRKVAVDQLTLAVQPGEQFALLGPNGAGKTTAIKVLVGLLRPNSGTVRICGFDVARHTRQALCSVGYVPDEPFLYPKLSGREFLEFSAEMRGLDRHGVKTCIARASRDFHLDDFLDDLVETYSHGMQQRLVCASALLHHPEVLVIDEPMVGLDPRSVRMVKDLLRTRALKGTSIFMSTHTLALAEEIADRIGIVDSGRLHFLGTVSQLQQELSSPHTSLETLFLELTDGKRDRHAPSPSLQPELPRSTARE
jgi:ABC-2 type transport system ATP-binding protein